MTSPVNSIVAGINNSLELELKESISMDELRNLLSSHIHLLINYNFNKLVSILYRIDVSEMKLRQLLQDNPAEDAGKIIAELIIDRQLQKIKTRKEGGNNPDIPEDDKW
jgi:hypothetical protein